MPLGKTFTENIQREKKETHTHGDKWMEREMGKKVCRKDTKRGVTWESYKN